MKSDAAWRDYWRQGAATTFGGTTAMDYQRYLLPMITPYLSSLVGDCDFLEICSGNGAMSLALAHYFTEAAIGYRGIATDANVAVGRTLDPQVQLEGPILAEKLPFPAGQFNFAISVFGLEYTDSAMVFAQLQRVIKPGGYFFALVHRIDSALSCRSRAEADVWGAVLATGGLVAAVSSFIEAAGDHPLEQVGHSLSRNKAALEHARHWINHEFSELQRHHSGNPTLGTLAGYLKPVFERGAAAANERRERWSRLVGALHQNLQRLEQQLAAAKDEHGMIMLIEQAAKVGMRLVVRKRQFQPHDMGEWIILERT